jgi:nucleoside-diphosphate-sugar epimerase
VDAALAGTTEVYVQPSVTFVYPAEGPVEEDTPIGEVRPHLESSLVAERQAARLADAGRRGVVLRLGLLDGPGTGLEMPDPRAGATLHVEDAGRALLAALDAPSGIYNVVRDGERVSNARFRQATGWQPRL